MENEPHLMYADHYHVWIFQPNVDYHEITLMEDQCTMDSHQVLLLAEMCCQQKLCLEEKKKEINNRLIEKWQRM